MRQFRCLGQSVATSGVRDYGMADSCSDFSMSQICRIKYKKSDKHAKSELYLKYIISDFTIRTLSKVMNRRDISRSKNGKP